MNKEIEITLPDDHPQSAASLRRMSLEERSRATREWAAYVDRCQHCCGTLPAKSRYCVWCGRRVGMN
jgi:hypothetical protein